MVLDIQYSFINSWSASVHRLVILVGLPPYPDLFSADFVDCLFCSSTIFVFLFLALVEYILFLGLPSTEIVKSIALLTVVNSFYYS